LIWSGFVANRNSDRDRTLPCWLSSGQDYGLRQTHAKAKAVRLVVLTAAMRLTWIILNDTAHIPDAAAIRNVWHHNQKIRERGRVSQLETSEADYLEAFAGE